MGLSPSLRPQRSSHPALENMLLGASAISLPTDVKLRYVPVGYVRPHYHNGDDVLAVDMSPMCTMDQLTKQQWAKLMLNASDSASIPLQGSQLHGGGGLNLSYPALCLVFN